MRALGWPAGSSTTRPGPCRALRAYARAPLADPRSSTSGSTLTSSQLVQLGWLGPHLQQPHQQQWQHAERTEQLSPQRPLAGESQQAVSPPLHPALLMKRIKAARSWQHLQALVEAHGLSMNHLHISAVVTHMGQLHTSGSDGGDGAASRDDSSSGSSESSTGDSKDTNALRNGVNLTDLSHLSAKERLRHDVQAAHELGAARHVPTTRAPGKPPDTGRSEQRRPLDPPGPGPGPSPAPFLQPLPVPSVRSQPPLQYPPNDRGAFLQQMLSAITAQLPNFKARQLANTLWAFGKLGHRPPSTWLAAVLARVRVQLPFFRAQHLANTLYALMQLGYMPPSPWLVDFFRAVDERMHEFQPVELASLCYAAGKLRLTPGRDVLGSMMTHSLMCFESFGIQELALLLFGLVNMGAQLHPVWMHRYRLRVARLVVESGAVPRPLLERWGPQLHPTALAAVVDAQLRRQRRQHQQLEQELEALGTGQQGADLLPAAVLRAHGGTDGPPGEAQPLAAPSAPEGGAAMATNLATILDGMAGWIYQPPRAFMEVVLGVVHRNVELLDAVQLTGLLLTLAHLDYRPDPRLFEAVWTRIMQSFFTLGRQHRTNALWAAARLHCAVPRRHVQAFFMRAASELYDHPDAEVVALLAAAARLRYTPRRDWLALVESHLFERMPDLQPFELVAVLQHLADLKRKPERAWMVRWAQTAKPVLAKMGLPLLSRTAYAVARLGFRPPASMRSELLRAVAERLAAIAEADRGEEGTGAEGCEREEPEATRAQAQKQRHAAVLVARGSRARRTQRREGVDDGNIGRRPVSLSRLLWSLAVLDIRPDADFVAAYLACLKPVLSHCTERQLSLILWALTRLRHDPGSEWTALFRRHASALAAGEGLAADGSVSGPASPLPRAEDSGTPAPVGESAGSAEQGGRSADAGACATDATEVRCCAVPGSAGGERVAGDSSRVILQGIAAWAERQLASASTKHAAASGR